MSMGGICDRGAMLCFEYYFENECKGFISFPNARKHLTKSTRPQAEWFFIVFERLET